MKMRFEVTLDVEDASTDEMEIAIANSLRVLEMPNGDTLFIDFPRVACVTWPYESAKDSTE